MSASEPRCCAACGRPIIRNGFEELTDRQTEIYDFIRGEIVDGRPSPTVRELMRVFGIASTNGVADHLKSLVRKGWLVAPVQRPNGHAPTRSYTLPLEEE